MALIQKKISDESEPGIDELIEQIIDDKIDDKMKIQYDDFFEHVKNYINDKLKNF